MNRREFIQGLSAALGATVVPAGLLASAAEIPDVVQIAPLQRGKVLLKARIGDAVFDFQGSIIVPAEAALTINFKKHTASISVSDVVLFVAVVAPEGSKTFDLLWYETGEFPNTGTLSTEGVTA